MGSAKAGRWRKGCSQGLAAGVSAYLRREGGLCSVMSNYPTVTAAAHRARFWRMAGERSEWATCRHEKCGPHKTSEINKAALDLCRYATSAGKLGLVVFSCLPLS